MAICALKTQHLDFPTALHRPRVEHKGQLLDSAYAQVFEAILERRINSTSRFTEASLAQMFGASRSIIRQVLARLSRQQVILLQINHRPQVSAPDIERTRQALHARRLTEVTLIRLACQQVKPASLQSLHELLDRERESADRGLRGQTLRLSGEFHLQLAELAGNTPLSRFLGSLVPPICLALAQFDATSNERETWRSHQAIVDAVERRNSAAAVELMNAHLDGLERQLFQAM